MNLKLILFSVFLFSTLQQLKAERYSQTEKQTDPSKPLFLTVRSFESFSETQNQIKVSDEALKQKGILACFKTLPEGSPEGSEKLSPWNCDKNGDYINLYQKCVEKLREKLKDPDFRISYGNSIEKGSSKIFELVKKNANPNPIEIAEFAYKYRLTPAGDEAARRTVLLLIDSGKHYLAYLFFLGWLSDQPEGQLCQENNKSFLTLGSALLISFNDPTLSKRYAEFEKCDLGFKEPGEREERKLKDIVKTPYFSFKTGLEIPDWFKFFKDKSLHDEARLTRMALSYSGSEKAFLESLREADPKIATLSLCEHLNPDRFFTEALNDSPLNDYKLETFQHAYPQIYKTALKTFVKKELEKTIKETNESLSSRIKLIQLEHYGLPFIIEELNYFNKNSLEEQGRVAQVFSDYQPATLTHLIPLFNQSPSLKRIKRPV